MTSHLPRWAWPGALLALVAAAVLAWPGPGLCAAYDPLRLDGQGQGQTQGQEPFDMTVHDARRGRDIPISVFLPPGGARPAPVVLFSHGLGGSRHGVAYLGRHWSARGYVVVMLQHPGSDESVWRGKPLLQIRKSLEQAMTLENLQLRVQDVRAVLDQLERWNADPASRLNRTLDMSRVGMSGHSFGAITTQAVSGQAVGGQTPARDPRIKAAVIMSPSSPRLGSPAEAFGAVAVPWLLMTGTQDEAPVGGIGVDSRLGVYPALPPGGKYELVLDGARHSAFTDRAPPRDAAQRNPRHHQAILALSTAFWDAWLKGDAQARAWLDGSGPRAVLSPEDRWRRK